MKRIFEFLKSKWFIQFLGILALSALLWFAGPLIAVAGKTPLESELSRVITIAVLVVVWIIYRLVAQIRAGRKDQQMMAELSGASAKSATEEASEEEVAILGKTFEEALQVLKQSRAQGKADRQFLYELPWYVIIGAPGSGKTTALVNSGLKFPLSDRLGKNAVRGVSGTRNCDWWFTDEAVLLDTAGRYTTQDSHQAVDAAAWQGFLHLLKKFRPRRPLNGILVSMSLWDLLQQTDEERQLHAKAIRRRIQELYQILGLRLPVYMLFTKSDLVAGFTDFFADLNQEERAQVWGETFPVEDPAQPQDFMQRFAAAYDELLQRLNARVFKRVQDERDVQRRSLILDYPQQMALLKPAMLGFLESVFSGNRFEERFLVRGIYLTSGTQEGTPIDRVMGILASTFRLDRSAAPVYSGRGKSFFLTRLLKDVVFAEAQLAGADPKVEQRQRWLQVGAYASALLLTLGVVGLWTLSYLRNQTALAQVQAQIDRYRSVDVIPTDSRSNFLALLPRLDALMAAREVYRDPGWLMGFGLYQGDKLVAATDHTYERLLKDYFQPLILRRLRERMQSNEAGNADVLYQLLQVYLMLGQPDKLDPKVVEPWIRADWELGFSTQPEVQAQLATHLRELLQSPLEPAPLDDSFVAAVRAKLTQVPQILQLYSRFRNEHQLDHSHDLKLGDALGPESSKVFIAADGKDLGLVTVPALYTAYGYSEYFLKDGLQSIKTGLEQNWVLGKQSDMDPAEIDRLRDDFKKLYLADYQKTWSGLLANTRLRRAQGLNQTLEILEVLARPNSPLKTLLETVEANTSLTKIASLAAELMAKMKGKPDAKPDPQTQKLLETARGSAGFDTAQKPDPVKSLENAFESLNFLVRRSPEKPAPIDATLTQLAELRDYVLQLGGAANKGDQALKTASDRVGGAVAGADVLKRSQLVFGSLPEPVKGWLLSLTRFGWNQTLAGAKGQLNDLLKTGVASQCVTALKGRYPLVRNSSQDVALADFGKLFAPNGILDQFFQNNLKAFVDTAHEDWRELAMDNQSLGLSPAAIRQFQYAAKIRDAFFPAGGALPQMQFELKPLSLDSNVATFRLFLEGQETAYRHGPEQVNRFQWPGPVANAGVRIVFETLDGKQVTRAKEGPWAWFRVLDEARIESTSMPDRFNVTFQINELVARYELRAGSVNNPLNMHELQAFRCPEGL